MCITIIFIIINLAIIRSVTTFQPIIIAKPTGKFLSNFIKIIFNHLSLLIVNFYSKKNYSKFIQGAFFFFLNNQFSIIKKIKFFIIINFLSKIVILFF